MVDLQHRLMRRTIHIAVSKALEDMKSNTRRSVRNLIDLGLLFSHSENQEWFFRSAKKVISNPGNPYNALAARAITDIDNETIKRVGLNLGYSSLIYGANKLRKHQSAMDFPIPWLLIFDVPEPNADAFNQIEQFVREGQALGIYSYVFRPRKETDITALCKIAKRFNECLFVFKTSGALITDRTAASLRGVQNAVVCVQTPGTDPNCGNVTNAFRILKQNRCLYGFDVNYNEANMEKVATLEYIRSAIELGNLFVLYIADEGVSDACRDAVYDFVCNERGERGQPLIALEWGRDMRAISEKILSGDGYVSIDFAGKVYCEYKKMKGTLANSLLEILQGMQPCTSS